MKRLFAFAFVVIMVLSLCACGSVSNEGNVDNNLSIHPTEPKDDRVVLDVFAGVSVEFKAAINGLGKSFEIEYDYSKVDYDKSNTDIKSFLEAIEFSSEDYTNLSNGDEIVVNASWSKSSADALGVKLLEESKSFTVEGLYDVYRSAEDVPDKLEEINGIWEALNEEIARVYLVDQAEVSYRYFYSYSSDSAGNPYISEIIITAVLKFEDFTATFVGYNWLYQEHWEMRAEATAYETDMVYENGEPLDTLLESVKLEEFFVK